MHKIFAADIISSNSSPMAETVSPNGFSKRKHFRRTRNAEFTSLYFVSITTFILSTCAHVLTYKIYKFIYMTNVFTPFAVFC